jgi:hypothetical protein
VAARPGNVYQATSARFPDPGTQRRLAARAQIGKHWPELPMLRQRAVLTALIDRIALGVDRIDIRLCLGRLGALLDVAATPTQGAADDDIQILSIPVRLRHTGSEIRMPIDGTDPFAAAKPDARLTKLLLKARRFIITLVGNDGVPFSALAEREGVSRSDFTRVVRLSYLAPDIAQAILDGRQPRDLTADKLLAHSRCRWPGPISAPRSVLPEPDPNSKHPRYRHGNQITGAAVLESAPTEILSLVGAVSPRHARLCRPR